MQDRLSELNDGVELPRPTEDADGDVEADADDQVEEQTEEFMREFFEDVSQIKQGLALIRKNIRSIEETYGQALVAVGLEQNQKSSEDLERLIDATNLAATDVRNRLKEMNEENKQMGDTMKGTAEFRIKTNMHSSLTKKFLELMAEYQEVQTKFKNKFRERVERQYRIVKPEATQTEIDEALESNNTEVFKREILNQRHAQAKDALNYIENRHRDILRLEQSIKELHQLFLDMAILVEAQGELLDQIEFNVSQAAEFTGDAVKNLRKANKLQKKSRKKMCCIVFILIIVLFLLGGGIGLIVKLV
eukprot:TRINITY_DN1834_c0_g1_i1.p1 TRINITY_DN1834_c0_g1~~TRINITY_DN1834_c0_g1_i1.p1  ORF type:complete len:305 (-),score=69.93 TRINITY_DN1834_c0_g1_i1:50-964(-)